MYLCCRHTEWTPKLVVGIHMAVWKNAFVRDVDMSLFHTYILRHYQ